MGGNVSGITLIRNIEPEFYDDLRVDWGKRAWGKGGKRKKTYVYTPSAEGRN